MGCKTSKLIYFSIYMNKLVELKFCLNSNQKGGSQLADFIPYSDHDKMSEDEKIKNPKYCPDMFPFLCNINSNANGFCRKIESDCNRTIIPGEPEKVPLTYKKH